MTLPMSTKFPLKSNGSIVFMNILELVYADYHFPASILTDDLWKFLNFIIC